MSRCYICSIHNVPTADPTAVGLCKKCGILTCLWDGARRHTVAEFDCAYCLVHVLVRSAGGYLLDPDGGGGGQAKAAVEAQRFLGTAAFEEECRELAQETGAERYAWRSFIARGLTSDVASRIGAKLDEFAGTQGELRQQVIGANAAGRLDPRMLGDAAGVAQHASRVEGAPEQLLGLRHETPEVETRTEIGGHQIGAYVEHEDTKSEEDKKLKELKRMQM
jgi:hypothetical protein